jgi:uncharacterized peroxidase-related enzyme
VNGLVADWRAVPLNSRVWMLLEFAEKITRAPAACRETDVHALRSAGFSDNAIHDAVQIVAYFNYINRVADALGVQLEPDQRVWGRA